MTKGEAGEIGGGPFDELLQDILSLPALDFCGQFAGRYISVANIVAAVERANARRRHNLNYGAIHAMTSVMPELLNCKVTGDDNVLSKDGVINTISNAVVALTVGAEKSNVKS